MEYLALIKGSRFDLYQICKFLNQKSKRLRVFSSIKEAEEVDELKEVEEKEEESIEI